MSGPDGPLLPCPPWCAGNHSWQELDLADERHESVPVVLELRSALADVEALAAIVQYPLAARPEARMPYVWARHVATAALRRPADVVAFADMLTGYAGRLRELAAELALAQVGDRPPHSGS